MASKTTCGQWVKDLTFAIVKGDIPTKLSAVIMGLWAFCRKRILLGTLYLAAEVSYIIYMVTVGWESLADFTTLGTVTQNRVFDETQGIYIYTAGDNSMNILLFGTVSLVLTVLFVLIWAHNLVTAYRDRRHKSIGEELATLTEQNYHKVLLTPAVLLVGVFTLLPLLFMVLIAFTNFDKSHQPPGNLFTWVGWDNFADILGDNPKISHTFFHLFGWTLVWAVAATFLNYLLGMLLALMINKKGIRFKKGWRLLFIITIAVPQFVSLMFVSQLLSEQGSVNVLLSHLGLEKIPFLTDPTLAKITVIVVNIWIGVPYSMLITSGILMNIPEDMYEAARIDGAGPIKCFRRITLPYMLNVTTPYLITQFVGNINNFNVIYLLTQGGPLSLDYYQAGKTDLLVTWLYKQTVEQQNYNLAAVIGIIVFILTSALSLVVYYKTVRTKEGIYS